MLQNGTFDFRVRGSTTNNLERQKQAAFSDTHLRGRYPSAGEERRSDQRDFPDLKDKAVVVTSGTTSEIPAA
ncbi:transporter substrate-binding domain-containing protein [Klebsiella pneumoniae subsp. pneumoniae]|nr:transporter substrate-binding domain-containing protein [Klebsiella pneumoniae subsp. pneumoniae]